MLRHAGRIRVVAQVSLESNLEGLGVAERPWFSGAFSASGVLSAIAEGARGDAALAEERTEKEMTILSDVDLCRRAEF